MSYNISKFVVQWMDDFQIPERSLVGSEGCGCRPLIKYIDGGLLRYDYGNQYIQGAKLSKTTFGIESMYLDGEGSGFTMREVFEPAFKQSTGSLQALVLWEGGDSISRLLVEDGDVKWIDLDLETL